MRIKRGIRIAEEIGVYAPDFPAGPERTSPTVNTDEKILRIMCPSLQCRRVLAVPESARGRTVKCKNCGSTVRIPVKAANSAPVEGGEGEAAGGDAAAA